MWREERFDLPTTQDFLMNKELFEEVETDATPMKTFFAYRVFHDAEWQENGHSWDFLHRQRYELRDLQYVFCLS